SEDEPFSFALFCLTERYYVLQAAVYVYRKRTGSIMTSSPVDRLAKGINSTILGALYIEQLIECISRFSNYDLWRENILNEFFNRFSKNHTLPHYRDSENIFAINKVIKDALLPFFGANEPFVKYFFNGFHIFRRQAENLWQQNQRLSALPAFLVRDQQNMLRIMDSIRANSKRIFVMGTPAHGNLGDQAIVWGELTILKNYFPDHEVIDIPYDYLTGGFGEIFWGLGFDKFVCDTGTIFLHGGGNLGNLWVNEEELRRKLIEKFPDNKIVIFPQSVCFTADDAGRKELELSSKIYNAHENLHLMTRDENSFNLAQKIFPNVNKYLMPDAATSLHGILDEVQIKREGVLFVLRGDKEKVRDDKKIETLQTSFHNANIPFEVIDTVINERVTELNREPKVREVLTKIRESKLVITDRFHGVIFSFITRTPVLAFKSFDTKISSGIKWFENVPSVFYAEDENWASMENFINRALGDDMPFAEMNPAVKFDSREIFLNVLNQIVDTPEVKLINRSTPPPFTRKG
ncbi:MAG: polysaccharide pyruvyl transferase family protein, partial [Selenomonadaceae bacterium]|nr:polysaccharide pyruvyl transferase family protein [Selenomonadaceae bacterium]